jgi:uncharacterized membrane protein YecN with MAPEG domain
MIGLSMTAAACVAALGILLFGLGAWISISRLRNADYYAGAPSPTSFTTKLSRAHGNTAEFAPFLAVLMIVVSKQNEGAWLEACMIGAVVSRLLVVIGFLSSPTLERMSLPKAAGAVGTYAFGLILSVSVVV